MDEKIINQVVEAVLRELANSGQDALANTDGMDRLLVIGDISLVPQNPRRKYAPVSVDDYVQSGNIFRYEKLLITRLSLTQLSDIAQGRDASPEACAVINALLNGIEVWMTDEALPHRRYAGKSSSRIYEVIENNARMLQTFGVKLIKKDWASVEPAPAAPPKYQAPPVEIPAGSAHINTDRVITEDVARKLAAGGQKEICLAQDAIVTPLAWDVFREKGIEVTMKAQEFKPLGAELLCMPFG